MSLLELFGRKPTVERLARDILATAVAAGEGGWRYEPDSTRLVKEGSEATVHLINVFLEYSQADKSQRRALVEKYATMLATVGQEIPKLWTLAQKNVYAVIRSRHDNAALEIERRASGQKFPERVAYAWHGDLVIRIIYDFGPSMGQVDTDLADTWGISREELLATAKRNLHALPKPTFTHVAPGVVQLVGTEGYQESLLLRDDVWNGLPVPGDIVAITPNRGVLLAAGADDSAAVEALLAEARECLQQKPWPLDPVIVTRRDGGWVAYEPAGRAGLLWRLHCKISLASAYAEQKDPLQKHVGEDVYVAPVTLMSGKDDPDQPLSFAVWTEGVPTLLPETDLLVFNKPRTDGKPDGTFVRWDDAVRVCGARMTRVPEQPPRWMVATFPDSDEWRALRAAQFQP